MRAVLATVALCAAVAHGYYLPGINPVSYAPGEAVPLQVNGLHSNTGILPFSYYTLPFCTPPVIERRHETLGEVLMGDRIETSAYQFKMAVDVKCQPLECDQSPKPVDDKQLKQFEKFIEGNYRGYLVLDNLPVFNNGSLVYNGQCKSLAKSEQYEYLRGYALGVGKRCTGGETLINNHLHFRIQYHKHSVDEYRVVGFTATPYSIAHSDGSCGASFDLLKAAETPVTTDPAKTKSIRWSFGVTWVEEPNIMWASRWDSYLHTSFADVNTRVHWFSIINSILIVLCLLSSASLVLVRSLRRDFAKYNAILADLETKETAAEESGWKIIHKWVKVPPSNVNGLIVLCGSGTQLLGMCGSVLFFACLGFLSPANRGALVGALVLLFVVQAFVGGYTASRMLKRFSEKSWVPIFQTGMLIPALFFGLFCTLNVLSWKQKASTQVPFTTLLALLALWLGISLPLTVLGAAFGFSAEPQRKDETAPAPRPIPEPLWYLSDWFCVLVPGLIPFATTFLELRFILASLWQGMVYYVFGFLAVVFVLWALTAGLTTVVVTYYRLCAEHYHWWWMAFLVPGSCGLHVALYSVYYFSTQLSITSTAGTLLYMAYMGMFCVCYVLVGGTIGFLTTYLFIRQIYSAIKQE